MKRILTLIIALAMVISVMPMASYAASTQHKVTITADKTTVEAGDTIAVSVTLDTNALTSALSYRLAFPNDAFVIDTDVNNNYNTEIYNSIFRRQKWPAAADTTWATEYKAYEEYQRWNGNPTVGAQAGPVNGTANDGSSIVLIPEGYTALSFAIADQEGVWAEDAITDFVIGKFNVDIASDVEPGDYEVYFSTSSTCDGGETLGVEFDYEPLTITVAGGEDDKTPAEKINLLTANGVAKSDVYVTNNDGSKYYVDSALVFVSSVDKGNAPVKTVITCDDFADTKLEIEAVHTQDINGLTYFAAAMSSIKETNRGLTFKATAYVTNADGEEVVGVPATGIFPK